MMNSFGADDPGRDSADEAVEAASQAEGAGHPRNADDRRWVRAVVDEHEAGLMRFATQKLGGDVERARDVVQDTFLKLWQADWTWVQDHLVQWLYTVCRNRCVDVRRKERRMTTFDASQPETGPAGRIGSTGTIQTDASSDSGSTSTEQLGGVLQAMNALSDRQQDVVRLKFQCGLSYKEIAGAMGITVNHVGVMLHQALKILRTHVSPDGIAAAGAGPMGLNTSSSTGTSQTRHGQLSDGRDSDQPEPGNSTSREVQHD